MGRNRVARAGVGPFEKIHKRGRNCRYHWGRINEGSLLQMTEPEVMEAETCIAAALELAHVCCLASDCDVVFNTSLMQKLSGN